MSDEIYGKQSKIAMATQVTKWAEHLVLLSGHSRRLLEALHCVVEDVRGIILGITAVSGTVVTTRRLCDASWRPILKAFTRKFPDLPDLTKVQID